MLFHCSITDFRWFFRSSCAKKCKQRCVYIICALMFWRDTVKYSFRFSPHVHYLVQFQVTHDVWWALPHESQQIHNLFSDILYFLRACWRNLALPVVTSTVFFFFCLFESPAFMIVHIVNTPPPTLESAVETSGT